MRVNLHGRIRTFLENDRLSFLAQQHADQKIRTRRTPLDVTEKLVAEIAQAYDPSPNHQYTDWILRQLRPGGSLIHPEDAGKVRGRLAEFDRLKKTPRFVGDKDINQYRTYADLAQAINAAVGTRSNKDEKQHKAVKGLKLLWEEGDNQIFEVTTVEAGLSLGWRDTEWCVKDPKFFNEYGPPFFCAMTNGKPKALLHIGYLTEVGDAPQCMDELDSPIPVLPTFAAIQPTLESLVLRGNNQDAVIAWVKYVRKSRWPEVEQLIEGCSDAPSAACRYAEAAGERWPEGEELIKMHAAAAMRYARNVINGRWPEGEETIRHDARAAVEYATDIIKGRWPEAEEAILQSPMSAMWYAVHVIKGRWPEAEGIISTDPRWHHQYTLRLMNR